MDSDKLCTQTSLVSSVCSVSEIFSTWIYFLANTTSTTTAAKPDTPMRPNRRDQERNRADFAAVSAYSLPEIPGRSPQACIIQKLGPSAESARRPQKRHKYDQPMHVASSHLQKSDDEDFSKQTMPHIKLTARKEGPERSGDSKEEDEEGQKVRLEARTSEVPKYVILPCLQPAIRTEVQHASSSGCHA